MNPATQPSIVEAARREFEREWAAGEIPELESFLPPADDPRFAATLEELIHLDIDFRWLRWAVMRESILFCEEPPPLEAYLQRFPILRHAEAICRLACTEFEARIESGQQPQVDEFVARLATAGLVLDPRDRTVSVGAQEPELVGPQQLKAALERIASGTDELAATNTLGIEADGTWGEKKVKATAASEEVLAETPQPQFGYQVLKRIAAGGMGVVFKARQLGLNRIVALKMIRSGAYASDEEVERFRREATAVAQLQHPNIVQIYDIGMQGESPYFSMEFVEGGTLAEWLTRGQLKVSSAARLLAEISAAVGYAHSLNILHRDLKPGNILLARRPSESAIESQSNVARIEAWMPKITDFGLAKQLNSAESGLTQSEAVLGTPCYMPPEQAAGQLAAVGKPSDVYSLGAILYEMLVGRPPFKADTVLETIRQVCSQEPVPPRRLNAAVPADLETICLKCLAKDPRARYHNALELNADLQRYLEGHPIQARPVGELERAVRWIRRNPMLCGLASATLAAVLLLGVAVLLIQRATRLSAMTQISEEVERRLVDPDLDQHHWNAIYRLADQLAEISLERAGEVRGRVTHRLAERIEEEIQSPKLDSNAVDAIEVAIDALESRSLGLAIPLRENLAQRLRINIVDYQATQLHLLFPPRTVRSLAAGVMPHGQIGRRIGPAKDTITTVAAKGNVEFVATFASGWEQSSQLAIILHAIKEKDSPVRGYRFELRAEKAQVGSDPMRKAWPGEPAQSLTFSDVRSGGRTAQLVITRDSQTLVEMPIPGSSLPGGELRLRARRDGNRLLFQVNDLEPLAYEEIFWSDQRNEGFFGLCWPPGVHLTRVQATRSAANPSSPLETGDGHYSDGQFEAALASYEQQHDQTNDQELRDEVNYKRALCLLALRRSDQALPLFLDLVRRSSSWSQLAGIQAWALYSEQGRFDEADVLFDGLTTRPDFKQLAIQIPPATRDSMLQRYRDPAGIYGLQRNPKRIEHLQRALELQLAIGSELWQISETRIKLVDAYDRADRLSEAREQAEYFLAHPNLSAEGRCRIVARMARILVRQGNDDAALACIDRALFSGTGKVLPHHEDILLTRAAYHGSRQDWQQAEKDLQLYFEPHLARTGPKNPQAWLLRGLVARRLDGNSDRARQIWAEGYRLVSQDQNNDAYLTATLGLISSAITDDQLLQIVNSATGDGFDSQVVQLIRKGLLTDALLTSVLTSAGKHPRTLDFLEQRECFQLSGEEMIVQAPRIVAHTLFTQMILGPPPSTRTLTDDEDQLLWELTGSLYEDYVSGEFTEWDLAASAPAAFLGFRDGWNSLAGSLPAPSRGPLAHVYASHFERLGKKQDAAEIWKVAKQDALPGSRLEKVLASQQQ